MPLNSDRPIHNHKPNANNETQSQNSSSRARSTSGNHGNYPSEPATPLRINAESAQNSYRFYNINPLQTSMDLPDWGNANLHHQDNHNIMQRTPTSSTGTVKRPPLPSPAISDPFILPSLPSQAQTQPNSRKIKRQNTGPIGLSLADDDFGDSNNSAPTSKSSGLNQIDSLIPVSPVVPRSGRNITSPGHGGEASADLLYE